MKKQTAFQVKNVRNDTVECNYGDEDIRNFRFPYKKGVTWAEESGKWRFQGKDPRSETQQSWVKMFDFGEDEAIEEFQTLYRRLRDIVKEMRSRGMEPSWKDLNFLPEIS